MLENKIHMNCVIKFAQCCAELHRQGMAFHAEEISGGFVITITGY